MVCILTCIYCIICCNHPQESQLPGKQLMPMCCWRTSSLVLGMRSKCMPYLMDSGVSHTSTSKLCVSNTHPFCFLECIVVRMLMTKRSRDPIKQHANKDHFVGYSVSVSVTLPSFWFNFKAVPDEFQCTFQIQTQFAI